MANISLSLAMSRYDRIVPILRGDVAVSGIDLAYEGMPGGIAGVFYDQMRFGRYDVSEMSISSYLVERRKGWPYVMLPVFHNRNVSYTDVFVRRDCTVRQDHPEDLAGVRFAIRDYQQSAGLWIRGLLSAEFGVDPATIQWVQTRRAAHSHTGVSGTAPPNLSYATADTGTLLRNGEVDAAWGSGVSERESLLARDDEDVSRSGLVMRLFADPYGEALRVVGKYGFVPPHHVTVVREDIVVKHPWVAASLMTAFAQAKRIAAGERGLQSLYPLESRYADRVADVCGGDANVYGVAANARALRMVQEMSVAQGLTPSAQPWGELFPDEVLRAEDDLPAVAL